MIFEIFQIPNGSFIYQKYPEDMREPCDLEKSYSNFLLLSQHQCYDKIKKIYRTHALKSKYYKSKSVDIQNLTSDFYEQFCALLYERSYKLKQIFMKVSQQVQIILLREIQKSFTLQIQTKSVQQLKIQGFIKVKQKQKSPYIVNIINLQKFWKLQNSVFTAIQQIIPQNKIQLQKISKASQLEDSLLKNDNSKKDKVENLDDKKQTKKVWQCDCNFSKLTFIPCCHQIRCCFTFFTSLEDQIHDFWLFNPKKLEKYQDNDNQKEILTQDQEQKIRNQQKQEQEQDNSESD